MNYLADPLTRHVVCSKNQYNSVLERNAHTTYFNRIKIEHKNEAYFALFRFYLYSEKSNIKKGIHMLGLHIMQFYEIF